MDGLLDLLRRNQGKRVSGTDLSRSLGISRTAVWKRINRLRGRGYRIDSAPRTGYVLVSAPDRLLAEEIQNGLGCKILGREIHALETIDSTNRLAAGLGERGAPEGTLVTAEAQTAGRGRLGRTWVSPAHCNLYFSLILRPPEPAQTMARITLAAAVSLCESLNRLAGVPVRIKWPNDLWVGGKKVGGILTEMASDMDRIRYVVLGVGINVNMTARALPPALRRSATSLRLETGRPLLRVPLLQGLLHALEQDYLLYREEGFGPFRDRWGALSLTLGRQVRVQMPHKEICGVAVELDSHGALRVRGPKGVVEQVISGDVFLTEKGPEEIRP